MITKEIKIGDTVNYKQQINHLWHLKWECTNSKVIGITDTKFILESGCIFHKPNA